MLDMRFRRVITKMVALFLVTCFNWVHFNFALLLF